MLEAGGGWRIPPAFTAWYDQALPAQLQPRHAFGRRAGGFAPSLLPLLAAAQAAQTSARTWSDLMKARRLAVGADKRPRLRDALDALLRNPVLTPKVLAVAIKMAPQTATELLLTYGRTT
jgi:hypothetical protein